MRIAPQASGLAVDARGGPVIDPTENVIALVKANAEAQAALRRADLTFNDAVTAHLKEVAELRARHAAELRSSDLSAAEKTRQVDVLASAASAATLATAVSTLQTTSDRNAETLRNQVSGNATTLAKQVSDAAVATQLQTDNLFRRVDERVAALERAAATGAGRQSIVDPQMADLVAEMRSLVKSQAAGTGKGEGAQAMWGYVVAGLAVLGMLITTAFTLIKFGAGA